MRFKSLEFAGVDIETTGSEFAVSGMCQIGVYLGPNNHFVSDVRPRVGSVVSVEALKVNGFTHERLEQGSDPLDVSSKLRDYLVGNGVTSKRLIAVGWNVAGLDLP